MGFIAGMRALRDRFHTCRPGYAVRVQDEKLCLRLSDGSLLDESEAAPHLLTAYQLSAELMRQGLSEPLLQ